MSKFDYFTDTDPTNGLVVFENEETAKNLNLTYVDDSGNFVLRTDTVEQRTEGRPSVRLQSQASYENAVIMLQVSHYPTGCAVWPAFWTVTSNVSQWPTGGEIDILENVNDQYPSDLVSLHVKDRCSVSGSNQTGTTAFSSCYAYDNDNSGCRIETNNTNTATAGSSFNSKGGGVVAMQRDFSDGGSGIRVWIWDQSQSMPSDVSKPGNTVDPDQWGTPAADFGRLSCEGGGDATDLFDAHKIVFDITLCGDWAGNAYSLNPQCPSKYQSCSNQVGQAGSSFDDAYWTVKNLYVYETGDSSSKSAASKLAPNCVPYASGTILIILTVLLL
ncbi:hypothetical protein MYAM1_001627 [Malassezia yamatoensis]|uniref:GH16 domain-containing protein n=1 Tax=Malassezia yamatoensis TaxID=253288 RepID=A0AAJ6CGK6_9BASI|nr:hypothetical protein MYAM1_001627 [Malassezia yamatoensis]